MSPISLLMLLAGPQADMARPITLPRLTPACTTEACQTGTRPSPYRLLPDHALPIDSKARAFANDGSYCAVVGDKYCRSKPRTLLSAPIEP